MRRFNVAGGGASLCPPIPVRPRQVTHEARCSGAVASERESSRNSVGPTTCAATILAREGDSLQQQKQLLLKAAAPAPANPWTRAGTMALADESGRSRRAAHRHAEVTGAQSHRDRGGCRSHTHTHTRRHELHAVTLWEINHERPSKVLVLANRCCARPRGMKGNRVHGHRHRRHHRRRRRPTTRVSSVPPIGRGWRRSCAKRRPTTK
jgi:hypothetical protein